MDRRRKLTRLVSVLGVMGLGIALVPFVHSLSPTDAIKAERLLTVDLNDIPLDGYKVFPWRGKPVAIFRPGDRSIDYLVGLNLVATGEDYQRGEIPSFFAYEQVSTAKGCVLYDSEKNEFTQQRYRGWYDPCHMGFWDYSGRNLPGVNAPSNAALPNLKAISTYTWKSESVIEFRP